MDALQLAVVRARICPKPNGNGHNDNEVEALMMRVSALERQLAALTGKLSAHVHNCAQSKEPAPPAVSDEEPPLKRHPSIREIQEIVGQKYGFSHTDMISARRPTRLAWARQVAMYLCTRITLKSLPAIGKHFGFRDHTTVLHARNKVTELLVTDGVLRAEIEALRTELRVEAALT